METEKELTAEIALVSDNMRNDFPELSTYLDEMQANVSTDKRSENAIARLKSHYHSLIMMRKYIQEYSPLSQQRMMA
jgi:hypothetical protein